MNTRFRFTKSKLDAIKPDPSKRLYFHDTETPGLGLTVTQKGAKSFFIKYGRAKAARRVALTRDDHSDDFPATSRFPELTVEQARKRAARVLLDKTQGTDPIQKKRQEDGSHSLLEAIDRYLDDPDRTLSAYLRGVLAWWRDQAKNSHGTRLGTRDLPDLKRSDFSEARDRLRKMKKHLKKPTEACKTGKCDCPKLSRATVNRRMSLISAVLTEALDWEWIKDNPSRLRRLSEDNERTRILSPDEQTRLLAVCKASSEPHLYPFAVTAMMSGARAGELLKLRWKDLDLDKGVARLLDTKNGTNRPAPIRGHALELLQAMKQAKVVALHGDDHVFKNKTGFTPFYYRKAWAKARKEARLEDFRFHDLRHVAASHLAMAGATQWELMEVLGHKSAQMTKRYSHFFDEHIAGLGDKLQERLFPDRKADTSE